MLTIKCGKCKKKVIKYRKIGKGKVLLCFKSRITKYFLRADKGDLLCSCGTVLGRDEGEHFRMIAKNFVCNGTKE